MSIDYKYTKMIASLRRILILAIGYILVHSGIFRAILFVTRKMKYYPVLMYHSVLPKNEIDSNACMFMRDMVVDSDVFHEHMRFLAYYYKVVNINDIMNRYSDQNFCNNLAVITFDDGLKDNYTYAFPILLSNSCTACFFIIGDTLVPPFSIWLHRIYQLIDSSINGVLTVVYKNDTRHYQVVPSIRQMLMDDLRSYITSLPAEEVDAFLSNIELLNGVTPSEGYYLQPEDIRKMKEKGFTFGAHSMSHHELTRFKGTTLEYEIEQPKSLLHSLTGLTEIPFAYPFGSRGSFDPAIVQAVKKSGYLCAFTTIEGLNGPGTDPFRLKRIEIQNFSKYELAVHLTGIIGRVKDLIREVVSILKG